MNRGVWKVFAVLHPSKSPSPPLPHDGQYLATRDWYVYLLKVITNKRYVFYAMTFDVNVFKNYRKNFIHHRVQQSTFPRETKPSDCKFDFSLDTACAHDTYTTRSSNRPYTNVDQLIFKHILNLRFVSVKSFYPAVGHTTYRWRKRNSVSCEKCLRKDCRFHAPGRAKIYNRGAVRANNPR
jgi:hypothetical protein